MLLSNRHNKKHQGNQARNEMANNNSCRRAGKALLCSLCASVLLLGTGGYSFSSGGTVVPLRTRTNTALSMTSSMDRGWDNDNFLESLGGGGGNDGWDDFDDDSSSSSNRINDAMERANDEYYRMSRYGRNLEKLQQQRQPPPGVGNEEGFEDVGKVSDAAAEIYSYSYNKNVGVPPTTASGTATSAAPPVGNANDPEEASQGGSRFRELMARAREEQRNRQASEAPAPPPKQNPLLAALADSVTPPSSIMTSDEVANLSIEEQARLYREFFYVRQKKKKGSPQGAGTNNNTDPKPIGSTDSNYLEPGIGFDGRKIGRNKDADAISNASDVYFARLKRDSTTRNLARYSGDHGKANDVFHDPAIQDIKAPVNPYLEDQRRRQLNVVETVPEEMLVFREFDQETERLRTAAANVNSAGISYKQRIAQKQDERQRKSLQQGGPPAAAKASRANASPGMVSYKQRMAQQQEERKRKRDQQQ